MATEGGTDRATGGKQHSWRIEPREYARHEARRGRRFAFPRLVPARTALVVIDMIPFFVEENPYCRGTVPVVDRLAGALRRAGGTVAWVVPAVPARATAAAVAFYGQEVAEKYRAGGGAGPPPARLWPGFQVHEGDVVAEKSAASAFFPGRCVLPEVLARQGIDTVLITGTLTNVCCESSARDASTLGLRVVMVADATAAVGDTEHNATLHTIYRSFGDVRPAEEVLTMIADGGARAAGPP
ncbi:isochorismatase family cysteine hydrolase [Amycolatopsis samaneae]|uniref:Isochorismatase family protein n=1 Tax=Amycolatopsis samaneae TaxID=664691 RepID=A0ABW5GF15_9PSEU